jgi:glucosylceramidase
MRAKQFILAIAISSVFLINTLNSLAQKSIKKEYKEAISYTTVERQTPMMSQLSTKFYRLDQPLETTAYVFIDPSKTFQTLLGIGGAITDAAAETYAKLPRSTQEKLLTAYYDKVKGIGYSIARTNINSCDFSSTSYTYVDEMDVDLKSFNIRRDREFKIPLLKAAFKRASNELLFFASPWSPPAWMKDNNSMLKGGKLKPEYYQSWANYYVKFIQAYQSAQIPLWGITVQNEPMAAQTWESCVFTAEEERDFIKNYLGPTLHANGFKNKKLIAWDHNRDMIYQRAATVLNDTSASKYVWGIGYHWYETWTGNNMQFDNVRRVSEAFPNTNLLFTEGCIEKFDVRKVSHWALGERYGNSIISDLNAGACGWTDWNILLDEKGGPNHANNFCFAPIHGDTEKGNLIFTNAYYYIGHFSKFIRPGAKRIISSANRDKLQNTAFLNTDGSIALVVLNTSETELSYEVWMEGKAVAQTSKPHSITTIVMKGE